MDLKTFTAQIELMHQEALRQSVSYEDKWLNTFHGGRESALDQVLKLLKGECRDGQESGNAANYRIDSFRRLAK